jgi:hypothetical protein
MPIGVFKLFEGWSTRKKIGVSILGLSVFVIVAGIVGAILGIGEGPKPAEFEVTSLRVGPVMTISADVKNVGETEGMYIAELRIDGVVRENKSVTLGGGETTTIGFRTTVPAEEGTHTIEVGEASITVEISK